MSAVLKEIEMITTQPLCRPFFETTASALYDEASFIAANRAALVEWFDALRAANECDLDCTFEEFCGVQYDLAVTLRDKREFEYAQLRAERDHARSEARFALTHDRDTGIARRGEI